MPYTSWDHESLAGAELNIATLEVDQEAPLDDVEELVFVVVLMPMVFSFQDAKPDHGVVHCTKGLVVPRVTAVVRESLNINEFERIKQDVHVSHIWVLGRSLVHKDLSQRF